MKLAAKIFLIFSIVGALIGIPFAIFNGLYLVPSIVNAINHEAITALLMVWQVLGVVVPMIINVVALVISSITLYLINKGKTKKEVTIWAILCCIFCGFISGLLILLCNEKEFDGMLVEEKVEEGSID